MGQASCVKSNSFPARTQWGHSLNGVVLYFIMYVMVKTSSQEQLAGRGSETSLSYQYNFCIKFSHKGAETIQGKKLFAEILHIILLLELAGLMLSLMNLNKKPEWKFPKYLLTLCVKMTWVPLWHTNTRLPRAKRHNRDIKYSALGSNCFMQICVGLSWSPALKYITWNFMGKLSCYALWCFLYWIIFNLTLQPCFHYCFESFSRSFGQTFWI